MRNELSALHRRRRKQSTDPHSRSHFIRVHYYGAVMDVSRTKVESDIQRKPKVQCSKEDLLPLQRLKPIKSNLEGYEKYEYQHKNHGCEVKGSPKAIVWMNHLKEPLCNASL